MKTNVRADSKSSSSSSSTCLICCSKHPYCWAGGCFNWKFAASRFTRVHIYCLTLSLVNQIENFSKLPITTGGSGSCNLIYLCSWRWRNVQEFPATICEAGVEVVRHEMRHAGSSIGERALQSRSREQSWNSSIENKSVIISTRFPVNMIHLADASSVKQWSQTLFKKWSSSFGYESRRSKWTDQLILLIHALIRFDLDIVASRALRHNNNKKR